MVLSLCLCFCFWMSSFIGFHLASTIHSSAISAEKLAKNATHWWQGARTMNTLIHESLSLGCAFQMLLNTSLTHSVPPGRADGEPLQPRSHSESEGSGMNVLWTCTAKYPCPLCIQVGMLIAIVLQCAHLIGSNLRVKTPITLSKWVWHIQAFT